MTAAATRPRRRTGAQSARRSRALGPRLGAAAARLGADGRGARAAARSARCWSGRPPGSASSTPASTRSTSSSGTCSTSSSGSCSAARHDAARLPDAARVRAVRLRRLDPRAAGGARRRWARRSTARTRGSCCRPASRSSRRSSRRSRSCSASRCCCRERRDGEDEPRDIDVVQALGFAAIPVGLIMLQPDLGTTIVIAFIVLGMLAVAGAPREVDRRADRGGRRGRRSSPSRSACSARTRSTRFAAFANPAPTAQGTGYNTQPGAHRDRLGRAVSARGCSTARRPTASSCPSSRPTSSSPWPARSSASSAPALIIVLLGVVLWRAVRIARRAEDLFGIAGRRRRRVLVRVPGVREHRDDAGHHAGHRAAAAVRLLRRLVDVRQHDGGRPAPERPPAAARADVSGALATTCAPVVAVICCMPGESVFPALEPLLPQVQQADPVRRRRAQLARSRTGTPATSAGR